MNIKTAQEMMFPARQIYARHLYNGHQTINTRRGGQEDFADTFRVFDNEPFNATGYFLDCQRFSKSGFSSSRAASVSLTSLLRNNQFMTITRSSRRPAPVLDRASSRAGQSGRGTTWCSHRRIASWGAATGSHTTGRGGSTTTVRAAGPCSASRRPSSCL